MSEHPMPKSKVSAYSDRIKHDSIPVNKYNNSNILAGILCRIWLTGFKCITTSSLLWPKWCLLKSEGESIKFTLNKLQKGNQKKPSTIIMYLYCVKIYNLFFNKCVYNSIILLYTSCLLLKKGYSYGCHTYK